MLAALSSSVDGPHQPTKLEASKSSDGRSIQASWYVKHPWISVCTSSFKVFCHVCCSAKSRDLISFSKRCKHAFIDEGFSCWKKALERFARHEKSEMHCEAVMKLALASSVNVSTQLVKQHKEGQRNNREMFLKLLEAVQFLAKQGLPLRGHDESSSELEGNLYQLLLLQAKSCPSLSTWISKRDYLSPAIVNEVISILGNEVL